MNVNVITLESLLDPTSEFYGGKGEFDGASDDPAEIAIECMDVMQELALIEQNLITLEAGKAIKKAKSASKKTKITKTKMKAKDAKAKKAGGKVKKIKKVTKEGDAELDGGTGPLPTTSDTNGLTDTDLDADPDAEVEVTEVVDTNPSEDVVGTEGVDFIVEYEDASIIVMENSLTENLQKFGKAIVDFIKKVGAFLVSIFKKFIGLFQDMDKFVGSNKAAIDDAFAKNEKIIKSQYKLKSVGDFQTFLDKLEEKTSEISFKEAVQETGPSTKTDKWETIKTVSDELFAGDSTGEFKIGDSGFKSADDLIAVGGSKAKQRVEKWYKDTEQKLKLAQKLSEQEAKADPTTAKANLGKIRAGVATLQKGISVCYKTVGKAISFANKVSRAAVNTSSVGNASAAAAAAKK